MIFRHLSVAVLSLVLGITVVFAASNTATSSGNWSARSTWGGAIHNDYTTINNGVFVTLDKDQYIRSLTLNGSGKLNLGSSTISLGSLASSISSGIMGPGVSVEYYYGQSPRVPSAALQNAQHAIVCAIGGSGAGGYPLAFVLPGYGGRAGASAGYVKGPFTSSDTIIIGSSGVPPGGAGGNSSFRGIVGLGSKGGGDGQMQPFVRIGTTPPPQPVNLHSICSHLSIPYGGYYRWRSGYGESGRVVIYYW